MVETLSTLNVSNVMIAANSNTVFKAIAHCKTTGMVAYCAQNTVLMLDPEHSKKENVNTPKVLFSLNAHETRINSVQWIQPGIIVSIEGDAKSFVIWRNDKVIDHTSKNEI